MTMESAITTKGQATIPKAVRVHLKVKAGDRIKFFMHPDGSVVILPKIPLSTLKGIVRSPKRPVSFEEMDQAIAEGAAESGSHSRR